MATDRLTGLHTLRTTTDRLGETVTLGNAIEEGTGTFGIAEAAFSATSASVAAVPFSLTPIASMVMFNASFGVWAGYWNPTPTATLTAAGATINASAFSMAETSALTVKYASFDYVIAGNATDFNLHNSAIAAGWNGTDRLNATINGGILISASSTGSYAMVVNGTYPNGVVLTNNGTVAGHGGNGGQGSDTSGTNATAGGAGGPALSVSTAITIINNGTFAGGGGGGGGGGAGSFNKGGGGGGGRGSIGGTHGNQGAGSGSGSAGSDGNSSTGGNGGASSTSAGAGNAGSGTGGVGTNTGNANSGCGAGGGGGWGAAGGKGGDNTANVSNGGSGGGGGACTSGNANITWQVTGNRFGTLG